MSHRHPHLSPVEHGSEPRRRRLLTLTGRAPSPAELKAYARWKVAWGLGLPLATRQRAARVITRL